jgi:hypothetical protein
VRCPDGLLALANGLTAGLNSLVWVVVPKKGGVEIDCPRRIPLYKAACCRLRFALSRQDVEEGIVQWGFPPSFPSHTPSNPCPNARHTVIG